MLLRILIIAVLLLLSAKVSHAETDSIYKKVAASQTIHCGYAEWPPFMTIDPDTKKVSGLMYDVWEMIGKKLNIKIDWSKPLGWGEITEAVSAGKIDIFCVGVWPDAGRIKNLLLSRPVFYTPAYLYARKDDTRFDNKYEVLNDPTYAVAGQEGDMTATILAMKFPKAKTAHISPMQQQGEMVLNVTTKKADVTLLDVPFANEYNTNNPGKIKRVSGAPVGVIPTAIPLAIGEYQLKSMIDTALNDLINDGTIAALIKKWDAQETYAPAPDMQLIK